MITRNTILAAMDEASKTWAGSPPHSEWLACSYWAARCGPEMASELCQESGPGLDLGLVIEPLMECSRLFGVKELSDLFIADALDNLACPDCGAKHRCPSNVIVGQRVYQIADPTETRLVLQPRFAELLAGLELFASHGEGYRPIAGFNGAGELVAVVMCTSRAVRQPKVAA